jgi:hypothetical protein
MASTGLEFKNIIYSKCIEMGNKKSKRKNSGGRLDCNYPGGILTRSSDGKCPIGSNNVNNVINQPIIKNTNPVNKVKSPIVTCKKDGADPQSFLVSELKKTKIKIGNKEEERPECPIGYYYDSLSKTNVAYQDLIPEENAQKILNDYNAMANPEKKTEEEENQSQEEEENQLQNAGKRKRKTFKRRKQRKQRKTNKK